MERSPLILETQRLALRAMTGEDVEGLLKVFSDPEAMRFYPKPFDRTMMQGWVDWNQQSYAQYGFGLWALILKPNNQLIGDCGLVCQAVDGLEALEIGYHVRRDLWGLGLATEAAQACREYGFKQLGRNQLMSLIHPDNVASRRVAEKTGMRLLKKITWKNRPICVYTIENKKDCK